MTESQEEGKTNKAAAAFELGVIYKNGRGTIPADKTRAIEYFTIALNNGRRDAENEINQLNGSCVIM